MKVNTQKNVLEDVKYSQGSILVSLLFLRCIDEYPQSVVSGNGTSTAFQHNNVIEIRRKLLREFSSLSYWFFDDKFQDKKNQF